MSDKSAAPALTTEADWEAARERLQRCEMLLDVSFRLSKCKSLDEIIDTLVSVFSNELRCERGSLFLNDPNSSELYSRILLHGAFREIRILNSLGIAGHVFTEGQPLIVDDAYADMRFNRSVDEQTGFGTRSILCLPIRTFTGEIMGVAEALNKIGGNFTEQDLQLLEEIVRQGTMALQGAQLIESMQAKRRQEMQFIDVVSEMTEDIKLGSLLQRVMGEATRLLNAERSTLFLNDEKTGELWSEVGQGLESVQIRLPNNVGIAGAVFSSGKSINIPYAYADLRFNPEFDRKTGFFTRSILCVPIVNKRGTTIGVTQVLNRRGGAFTDEDESRLRAFTAQISIALENAKLFADVQAMKNYNESMLESMSSGVITFDADDRIVTCNAAGLRILRVQSEQILHKHAPDFFGADNAWFVERLRLLVGEKSVVALMDAEFKLGEDKVSVNLTLQPLLSAEGQRIGAMALLDNISNEKRLKSTMARYMDPGIADQMLAHGAEALGGKSVMATVLFSDIRGFTTLTEALGAQETVSLLNEYFSLMVACIKNEDGMLDKFIGDAIMSAFGIPMEHNDDPDRAVRAAIQMMRELAEWNRARAAQGKLTVDIGIGINTDNVVSGNIGSQKRMDYTIIGDGVNLAARLESACKMYGTHILISEYTYKQLRGTYYCREVDLVIVKGKTQPVAVYEVMDYHTPHSYPNLADALHVYRVALGKYRSARWASAIEEFERLLDLNPADNLAPLYLERCRFFAANPPGAEWSGVWKMQDK
jgi:adenylate cyclase